MSRDELINRLVEETTWREHRAAFVGFVFGFLGCFFITLVLYW